MVEFTPIGTTNHQSKKSVFGIRPTDRFGHIYCIGKTGTGKSTLLFNMASHDIVQGEGVCVIDPHGDISEKILSAIPEHRIKDVIYLNVIDREYVIPFNPLSHYKQDAMYQTASGIVSAFKKIWAESWGPRLEHILRNTILSLLHYPNSSLLDIAPLLTNSYFRNEVISHVTDAGLVSFWKEEFNSYTPSFRNEVVAPILNKVGIFQSSPLLKHTVGGALKSINVKEILNGHKILIANLSKGIIGEEPCSILGSLLLTQIQVHALDRTETNEEERIPFHVYVDEAHTFITQSFSDILSEARKYKLSLFLTHQYTEQLPEDIRAAIFGNCGTFISFRVGHSDAEIVAKEFFPIFAEEDLVQLPRYACYLKLLIDGETSPPFSATTLPPATPIYSFRNTIVQFSRQYYGRCIDLVKKEIDLRALQRTARVIPAKQNRLFGE